MTGPGETPAICITRARKLRLKPYLMRSGSLCDNYHAVFLPAATSLAVKYARSRCTPSLQPSDRNCPRRERRGRMSGFTQQMRGGESSDLLGGEPLPQAALRWKLLIWDPIVCAQTDSPGPAALAVPCRSPLRNMSWSQPLTWSLILQHFQCCLPPHWAFLSTRYLAPQPQAGARPTSRIVPTSLAALAVFCLFSSAQQMF